MQVPCYWVPQLQMEMLASNTASIVLLSRSATRVSTFCMLRLLPSRQFRGPSRRLPPSAYVLAHAHMLHRPATVHMVLVSAR